MTVSLSFRMATSDDVPQIVCLLNNSFRTPLDVETWNWFTSRNPAGASRVYLATEASEQTIAGIFAFSPVALRLEGVRIAAVHGHHLALRPAYQGGKAFVALSRYALESEAARGVKIVIGLLNPKSYQPQKVLMRWTDFGFLRCLVKSSVTSREHNARLVHSFPDDFDTFYGILSQRLAFGCDKTREWMNWRFCQRPGAPYTIYITQSGAALNGYVVLKRWREPNGYSKAHIIDLHVLDDASLPHLVAAAEAYAVGCDELNLWAIQGYPYRSFLERAGFVERDAPPQPLAARSLDANPPAFPNGSASFSYGDGDTVY